MRAIGLAGALGIPSPNTRNKPTDKHARFCCCVSPCRSCQLNALKGYNNKITRLLADRRIMEFIKSFPTIFHCSTQDVRGQVHTASLCEHWRSELLQLQQQAASQAPRPSTPREATVVTEAPSAAGVHLCSVCQGAFSSRNRLFQHVKLMRTDDAGHLSCVEARSSEAQRAGAGSGGRLGQRERERESDERAAERRREMVLEDECFRALRRRECKESKRHTFSKQCSPKPPLTVPS